MAASLLGLALFLGSARAPAQELPPLPAIPDPAAGPIALPPIPPPESTPLPPPRREKTLHFSRDPVPQARPAPPGLKTAGGARPQPQRVALQNTTPPKARELRKEQQAEESVQYTVPTEVPSPERLFKTMQSDEHLMEAIRQEKRSQNVVERITFPEEQPLSKVAYAGRRWEPLKEEVQPCYVMYKRLLFEQKNAERYGWDVGVLQPLISSLKVYCDIATLPYHLGARPFQQFECSTGYCLPGDPVPLLLYPPEWSVSGSGLEAAVLVPLFFAFP